MYAERVVFGAAVGTTARRANCQNGVVINGTFETNIISYNVTHFCIHIEFEKIVF